MADDSSKVNRSENDASKSYLQSNSIMKWTNKDVLEWLQKRLPEVYYNYSTEFIKNQITGESIMDLKESDLETMNMNEKNLRDQMMDEISLLKMRHEYDFFKHLKTSSTTS